MSPYVNVDARDSDNYAVYVTQSGLTLPDRDYYLEDEPRYEQLRSDLKVYIADMLTFLDVPAAEAAADAIFEIETKIAEHHWTKTENRDPIKTYNKKSTAELRRVDKGLSVARPSPTPAASAARVTSSFASQVTSRRLAKSFAETDLEDWKNYLRLRIIDSYATSLSEPIERRHFDFHDTAISGITEQEPLWKRGVNVTGSVVG